MSTGDAELMRARLHVRAGHRRLRQGKAGTGISVMYDAFLASLRWYAASPERLAWLGLPEGDGYDYERRVYDALARAGLTEGGPDFGSFEELSERALEKDLAGLDYQPTIIQLEHFLTNIGVMPFDEDSLPPEAPDAP
ncbi:MAG: hypothetical protein HZC51_05435 [Nitrospirae bacterium]|nr:hypothetical protein [Nitrospirota bacterium]